jgi:hypothetical protein
MTIANARWTGSSRTPIHPDARLDPKVGEHHSRLRSAFRCELPQRKWEWQGCQPACRSSERTLRIAQRLPFAGLLEREFGGFVLPPSSTG